MKTEKGDRAEENGSTNVTKWKDRKYKRGERERESAWKRELVRESENKKERVSEREKERKKERVSERER